MTSPRINSAALERTPSSDAIYSTMGMECSDLLPMSAKEEPPLPEISNENKTHKALITRGVIGFIFLLVNNQNQLRS